MKILVHSSEAGFSTFIEPILQELQKEGHLVKLELHSKAIDFLSSFKQSQFDFPDLVFTGFDDVNIDLTSKFLQKYSGKPAIGFLDSWRGINRFWKENGDLRRLSNLVLVPSSFCLDYLIQRGLPLRKLHTIGHPAMNSIQSIKLRKKDLLESFSLPVNYKVHLPNLVFFSEPLRLPNGERPSLTQALTKNGSILIDEVFHEFNKDFNLFLKLHPIEKAGTPSGWFNIDNLRLEQALALSDKTLGVASTVMSYSKWACIETHCLSRQLLNWQPSYSDVPIPIWEKIEELNLLNTSNLRKTNHLHLTDPFSFKEFLNIVKLALN